MKQKIRKSKVLIAFIIFNMIIATCGYISPAANAASLVDVKDTISTSAPSTSANHTINFKVITDLVAGQKVKVTFPGTFNLASATTTCPANTGTGTAVGQTITCTATGAVASTSNLTFLVTGVVSPAKVLANGTADTYQIYIESTTAGDVTIERADAMVAIIESVTMTASIEATLAFTISGVNAGVVVNGVTTTGTSTATTTPFGTLSTAASSTLAQRLNVTTNATDGYTVTVQQDHELLSNSGDDINSFNNSPDNTGSTTPGVWAAPLGTLDAYNTYGHMGLTTNDGDLGGTPRNFTSGSFYNSKYAGLNATNTMAVMSHDGPSDGTTNYIGSSTVAYTIQITTLQEAGDYQNTLTYVCTPQY